MSEGLINWTENEGSPYKTPQISYEFEPPSWRILTEGETDKIRNIHKQEDFKFFKIFFPLTYYLWRICKLNDVEATKLLTGFNYANDQDYLSIDTDDVEFPEGMKFNFSKPVLVYTSYPFQSMLEIKIFPFKQSLKRFDGKDVVYDSNEIGYILWQISKVYEKIYKEHWKEVGVWGHQFSDLAFARLTLLNDNLILLQLDS